MKIAKKVYTFCSAVSLSFEHRTMPHSHRIEAALCVVLALGLHASTAAQQPDAEQRQRHLALARDYVTSMMGSPEDIAARQARQLASIRELLDTMRVLGQGDCATTVETKLTTPMFLRDEVARELVSHTEMNQLGRVFTISKAAQTVTNEAEAAAVAKQVYPGVDDDAELMRLVQRDSVAVITALKVSITNASDVVSHYCRVPPTDPVTGAPPARSLAVSCNSAEYRILNITPPTPPDIEWRIRYQRGNLTGTWTATPATRAKHLGTTTCEFHWQ